MQDKSAPFKTTPKVRNLSKTTNTPPTYHLSTPPAVHEPSRRNLENKSTLSHRRARARVQSQVGPPTLPALSTNRRKRSAPGKQIEPSFTRARLHLITIKSCSLLRSSIFLWSAHTPRHHGRGKAGNTVKKKERTTEQSHKKRPHNTTTHAISVGGVKESFTQENTRYCCCFKT